jgi:hypothetical protein
VRLEPGRRVGPGAAADAGHGSVEELAIRTVGGMTQPDFEQLFDTLVHLKYAFLEAKGYVRCPTFAPKVDPRDAFRRIRYHDTQATIDVKLAIGLGLFTLIRIGVPDLEQPCEAERGRDTINVETIPGSVTLPSELQVRKSKTLYEGYSKHVFIYQKVLAKHFETAITYLGEKTREVEEQLVRA